MWLAEQGRYGVAPSPARVEQQREALRVGLVPDGCFGPEGVAVRASASGLMFSDYGVPLLNAVERRWADHVLDAWVSRERA